MKHKLFIMMSALLLLLSVTATAQTQAKITAVINRADWCPVCKANGEKVMKEVIPVFNESNVQFVINDLTDEATISSSKVMLTDKKVYDAVMKIKSTGQILLVDMEKGKIVSKISVAEPAEKIIQAIKHSAMSDKM
jgi:hypothetical protein